MFIFSIPELFKNNSITFKSDEQVLYWKVSRLVSMATKKDLNQKTPQNLLFSKNLIKLKWGNCEFLNNLSMAALLPAHTQTALS